MEQVGVDRLSLLPAGEARIRVRPMGLVATPEDLLHPLAAERDPVLLDSSAYHKDYGRYALAACCPLEVLTLRSGILTNARGEVLGEGDQAIWDALTQAFGAVRLIGHRPDIGYLPGWIGYVGYEVARHIERLPQRARRETNLPDLRLAFYDAILLHDAADNTWCLVDLEYESSAPDGRGAQALKRVTALTTPAAPTPKSPDRDLGERDLSTHRAESSFAPQAYRNTVARCVDYIAAGDIFQVNLSQRFAVQDAPEPLALYRALRRRNPSFYACYMTFEAQSETCAILSSSPELFLRVRGREVETRPIKGTRPRTGEAMVDMEAARDLLASPKDNAELAMIVDLLRNDLGKVCEYGSVKVQEPRRLEEHPTVYHLVATVRGILRESVGPAELLRATFPGGSITGAPKIRAMEIIDELEDTARGVYTGCIGHVGVDGSCEWNIAIRTIIWDAGRALIQVGGGIVADSTPEGEYQETLDKARALLEAVAISNIDTHQEAPER
jgi:para-aminobenzoate synthetase component I